MSTMSIARTARRYGANYAWTIAREARRADIPVSLGLALIEQESNFSNVFGHDPTIYVGAGQVTKAKYLAYKAQRGATGRGGMQGVGPAQLTYYSFQDRADAYGGAWRPRYNIRVAFEDLAALIRKYGTVAGIKAYNGTGPAADRYSENVRYRWARWHRRLTRR